MYLRTGCDLTEELIWTYEYTYTCTLHFTIISYIKTTNKSDIVYCKQNNNGILQTNICKTNFRNLKNTFIRVLLKTYFTLLHTYPRAHNSIY